MPDQTRIPFRKRCSGQNLVCVEGNSFFQHKKAADVVDSYAPSTSPVPLPNATNWAPSDCVVCDQVNPVGGGGYDASDPGHAWQSVFFQGDGTGEKWQVIAQDMRTFQTFTKGAKTNLGVCHKFGFKGYAGQKQWHGMYGFLDNDSPLSARDRSIAPSQTKYLTIKRNAVMSYQASLWTRKLLLGPDAGSFDTVRHLNVYKNDIELQTTFTVDPLGGTISKRNYLFTQTITFTQDGVDATGSIYAQGAVSAVAGNTTNTGRFFNAFFNATAYGSSQPSWNLDNSPGNNLELNLASIFVNSAGLFSGFSFAAASGYLSGGYVFTGGTVTQLAQAIVDSMNFNDPGGSGTVTTAVVNTSVTPRTNGCSGTNTTVFTNYLLGSPPLGSASASVDGSASVDFSNTAISVSASVSYVAPFYGSSYDGDREGGGPGGNGTGPNSDQLSESGSLTIDIELSDPYTSADVYTDIKTNLISLYRLNGKEPWRTDAWTSIFPLVARREVQANINPDLLVANGPSFLTTLAAWVDPNITAGYDGAIIGAPMAQGEGGSGWFDAYYNDQRFCFAKTAGITCGGGPDWISYPFAEGGTLADAGVFLSGGVTGGNFASFLPSNATHWTDNIKAHSIPRGALIDIGTMAGTSRAWFVLKYAETRLPVPSYNAARPCGSDRVLIDELTASCKKFGDETTTLTLVDGSLLPDPSGKQLLVWKSQSHDGIWTGVTLSGTTLDFSGATKIANLPTDYFHAFEAGFTFISGVRPGGLVGIVRFPNASALCGKQQITFTDNGGGTTKITFAAAQTNLRTGDALDFWATGMAALAVPQSNKAVTRIDDSNFTVAVAFADMAGAIWATSHGAAAWYFNDASQKFEFRFGSWKTDYRNLTDSAPTVAFGGCNPACLPFSPCSPQVMAFTPNDDFDADWGHAWFGDGKLQDFTADGVYGARVQANVEFEIQDVLYQSPKCPCVIDFSISCVEDDGSCAADVLNFDSGSSTLYYPPHPRMEARCSLPNAADGSGAGATRSENAPALPTDSVNGALTWPAMVQPLNPGNYGESYTVRLEPWARYKKELISIEDDGCRWQSYYYAFTLGGGK